MVLGKENYNYCNCKIQDCKHLADFNPDIISLVHSAYANPTLLTALNYAKNTYHQGTKMVPVFVVAHVFNPEIINGEISVGGHIAGKWRRYTNSEGEIWIEQENEDQTPYKCPEIFSEMYINPEFAYTGFTATRLYAFDHGDEKHVLIRLDVTEGLIDPTTFLMQKSKFKERSINMDTIIINRKYELMSTFKTLEKNKLIHFQPGDNIFGAKTAPLLIKRIGTKLCAKTFEQSSFGWNDWYRLMLKEENFDFAIDVKLLNDLAARMIMMDQITHEDIRAMWYDTNKGIRNTGDIMNILPIIEEAMYETLIVDLRLRRLSGSVLTEALNKVKLGKFRAGTHGIHHWLNKIFGTDIDLTTENAKHILSQTSASAYLFHNHPEKIVHLPIKEHLHGAILPFNTAESKIIYGSYITQELYNVNTVDVNPDLLSLKSEVGWDCAKQYKFVIEMPSFKMLPDKKAIAKQIAKAPSCRAWQPIYYLNHPLNVAGTMLRHLYPQTMPEMGIAQELYGYWKNKYQPFLEEMIREDIMKIDVNQWYNTLNYKQQLEVKPYMDGKDIDLDKLQDTSTVFAKTESQQVGEKVRNICAPTPEEKYIMGCIIARLETIMMRKHPRWGIGKSYDDKAKLFNRARAEGKTQGINFDISGLDRSENIFVKHVRYFLSNFIIENLTKAHVPIEVLRRMAMRMTSKIKMTSTGRECVLAIAEAVSRLDSGTRWTAIENTLLIDWLTSYVMEEILAVDYLGTISGDDGAVMIIPMHVEPIRAAFGTVFTKPNTEGMGIGLFMKYLVIGELSDMRPCSTEIYFCEGCNSYKCTRILPKFIKSVPYSIKALSLSSLELKGYINVVKDCQEAWNKGLPIHRAINDIMTYDVEYTIKEGPKKEIRPRLIQEDLYNTNEDFDKYSRLLGKDAAWTIAERKTTNKNCCIDAYQINLRVKYDLKQQDIQVLENEIRSSNLNTYSSNILEVAFEYNEKYLQTKTYEILPIKITGTATHKTWVWKSQHYMDWIKNMQTARALDNHPGVMHAYRTALRHLYTTEGPQQDLLYTLFWERELKIALRTHYIPDGIWDENKYEVFKTPPKSMLDWTLYQPNYNTPPRLTRESSLELRDEQYIKKGISEIFKSVQERDKNEKLISLRKKTQESKLGVGNKANPPFEKTIELARIENPFLPPLNIPPKISEIKLDPSPEPKILSVEEQPKEDVVDTMKPKEELKIAESIDDLMEEFLGDQIPGELTFTQNLQEKIAHYNNNYREVPTGGSGWCGYNALHYVANCYFILSMEELVDHAGLGASLRHEQLREEKQLTTDIIQSLIEAYELENLVGVISVPTDETLWMAPFIIRTIRGHTELWQENSFDKNTKLKGLKLNYEEELKTVTELMKQYEENLNN